MGTIQAAVWDVTSQDALPDGIEPGSVDIVVLIFVLSALHPLEWTKAVRNIYKVSGTLLTFRSSYLIISLTFQDVETRRASSFTRLRSARFNAASFQRRQTTWGKLLYSW